MTKQDFIDNMRLSRGKLTKETNALEYIWENGTPALLDFALSKKLMGVRNIHWIATQDLEYQTAFTDWMRDKNWKASKDELDLWFSQNKGR